MKLLMLPPLTEDTRSAHLDCMHHSFDTYTPELVDLFFYSREHVVPALAQPAGTVFLDGLYSLYAAQVAGYLHRCNYADVSAELAYKILYILHSKLIDLFYSVLRSNFAELRAATDTRLQNIGTSCFNSAAQGVSNHAHLVTHTMVRSVKEAATMLRIPDVGLTPFFQNLVSIRSAQYSLMLTDANCVAHNILSSESQYAFFMGGAIPATKNKGLLHCAYTPTA